MSDDEPITLQNAARTFFRGKIKYSTLKGERDRGNLRTFEHRGLECTTRNDLKEMIKKKTAQNKRAPARAGVYIIGYGSKVKIGITIDFTARLDRFKMIIPEELYVYGFIDGAKLKDERSLHRRFQTYRITGEWFHKKGALAKWIKAGCPNE